MHGVFGSQMEKMTSSDAKSFPIIGSCVLFGLYILFKVVPKDILNAILSSYFVILGTHAPHSGPARARLILHACAPSPWHRQPARGPCAHAHIFLCPGTFALDGIFNPVLTKAHIHSSAAHACKRVGRFRTRMCG